MRWDNLRVDEEERRRLPGYREEAVIRRFDAPEALDTRFYEIRAKSALNRVHEASQVPFRWTINPYRGCSHACLYCLWGNTPILMADGRTRPIAELDVGDRIVGTEVRGRYRRYVETEVLQHWQTVKPAYRIELEDGTVLIASGDHRFLTRRGWKYVTGAESGWNQRPHLTLTDELLGTGKFAHAPEESAEYRRGYLCGIVRGEAHLRSGVYTGAGRRPAVRHRFRLALTDEEALLRAQEYLLGLGIYLERRAFAAATATRRPLDAIHASDAYRVGTITEAIRWPLSPSDDWRKGFLAGIFDAEGSCGREALRIPNKDRAILDWTLACFRHFGFDVVEEPRRENGVSCVRLRGGLRERLRFFHMTDPAITRKRQVQGFALKSDARTRVVSIEPMSGAARLYDITTGTGDFIANGVVSHNCFARPTHKYLDLGAGRDFEKEIVVKVNVPEVLRTELARKSWKGEHVAMGTNTDPYQWVEGRYKLMRGIWEAMRDFANPCSILTKSPLLLRDLDLMKEVAERAPMHANLSIPTMDEKAWRASEPHTPNPKARMEAVAALNEAGIPCGILVAPLMPGINDSPEQVERILTLAAEAGATGIGGIALHLRGEVKEIFMDWLRSYRPDLVPRYEELYRRGAYAPPAERKRLAELVRHDELRGGTWPRDLRGVAAANGRASAGEEIRAIAAAERERRAVAERERRAELGRRQREEAIAAAAQQALF
ncbi:MAG TPA: intein-containing Rv2578c family radical SAM protein [Solirubrobacteraceae bacterium]|nr:intein-containing Rv2578c family radical SAM protein [Solirubrobacteraceae bacterium]